MKKHTQRFTGPNDAWIFHREDMETIQDGSCNIYLLIDAYSGFCFDQEISTDIPAKSVFVRILKAAYKKSGTWPEQILISKKDPAIKELKEICAEIGVTAKDLPPQDLSVLVKPISDSLHQFRQENTPNNAPPFSDEEREELKAFIPDTYGICSCGSGKKFKFCCQKIFKNITLAMCAAEEGKLEEALKYMQEADSKVGKTPEVLCRFAICWSFFDMKKSHEYLKEAIKLNPNHPRSNYILGVDHVAAEKYDEAIKYYRRAIDHYPVEDKFHLSETYNNLGSAFFALRKFKEAKDSWEKALVLMPTDKMVAQNLFDFIYGNTELSPELRKISAFIEKFLHK